MTVVHFEKDDTGKPIRHVEQDNDVEVIEAEPDKSPEDSLHEIVDAQKRRLDQWCFAEHYEKHVLLQVQLCCSFAILSCHIFMSHFYCIICVKLGFRFEVVCQEEAMIS